MPRPLPNIASRGVDCQHILDLEMGQSSDSEIWEYASQHASSPWVKYLPGEEVNLDLPSGVSEPSTTHRRRSVASPTKVGLSAFGINAKNRTFPGFGQTPRPFSGQKETVRDYCLPEAPPRSPVLRRPSFIFRGNKTNHGKYKLIFGKN